MPGRPAAMFHHKKFIRLRHLISHFVLTVFIVSSCLFPHRSYGQMLTYANLPAPGRMIDVSSHFVPVMIKGLKVYADDPLKFDFILDSGNERVSEAQFQAAGIKLAKYFLAGLTVSEDDLWVNLSPYEKNRIIPESFGGTLLGRDLLAQDYILKQLSSSLIFPDSALGKKFWSRVYTKARQMYGTADIAVNTFNKVWIVPDKAEVWEHGGTAFVTSSHLRVLSQEDYLSFSKHMGSGARRIPQTDARAISRTSSEILRGLILPEIEQEVNEGANFANLRQIYNAMILAVWYKQALKESLLAKLYVNRNETFGINPQDPQSKARIYQQYLAAFKKGVFNFIREDLDAGGKSIPRKYFSGGADWAQIARAVHINRVPSWEDLPDGDRAAMRHSVGALRRFTWSAQEMGPGANAAKITQAIAGADQAMLAPWKEVHTPAHFVQVVGKWGLSVSKVEAAALKPQGEHATAEYVLNDSEVQAALSISIPQALGSVLFSGRGSEAKVPADSNAVHMGHEGILQALTNEHIAIVSIASEGLRDNSVGTPLGRIYWSGYEGGFKNSQDLADYNAQIDMLRGKNVELFYFLDDGLENTNALKAGAPDAWSVTALQRDNGAGVKRHFLDEEETRRVSVVANAPRNAGFTALDTPRIALQKLAAAYGYHDIDSAGGRDFARRVVMAILGERKAEDTKESGNQRHKLYIDEILQLQKEYGVTPMIFGDGDLMPALLAATGIKLDDEGKIVVKFGRSGSVEGEIADLTTSELVPGVPMIDGVQLASRAVSNQQTKDGMTPQNALKNEEGLLDKLIEKYGYYPDTFNTERHQGRGGLKGKAVIALTAVTGADKGRYGAGLADQLRGVAFDEKAGTVTTSTFLVTPQGAFAVRTTMHSKNLGKTKNGILDASPEGLAYVKKSQMQFPETKIPSGADGAMTAGVWHRGGIDLRPEWFDLQIRRDASGIPLPMTGQPIASMKIRGFTPVPLDFKPMDLDSFLHGGKIAE